MRTFRTRQSRTARLITEVNEARAEAMIFGAFDTRTPRLPDGSEDDRDCTEAAAAGWPSPEEWDTYPAPGRSWPLATTLCFVLLGGLALLMAWACGFAAGAGR